MPELNNILSAKLTELEDAHLLRTPRLINKRDGVHVLCEGKTLTSFCDNDYFGLASDADVVAAGNSATQSGAMASRLVTGNHAGYAELEELLASIKGTETACVFGSGYLANVGTIAALVGKGDLIVADKLAHACMIDGAKLSGATLKRFSHNDVDSAKRILDRERGNYQNCIIATETVFSMDGDVAPLAELRKLADKHDAWLMTDDAHGLGIVKSPQADIQMGTLSKGAGCYGGYVCGSRELVDYLKTSARSLIYSTALPPSVIASGISGLKKVSKNNFGEQVIAKATLFADALDLPKPQSAIVPVIVGNVPETLAASEYLKEHGFLVSAIRPPTVPEGTARLRVTFSVLHADEDILGLAEAIKALGVNHGSV
jgi:8-amino-7-oxononanoate synthase